MAMAHDFSLIRVMMNGGWTIGVLILLSVLAFAIILDRFRAFRKATRGREELMESLAPLWKNASECAAACVADGSLPALAVASGIEAKKNKSGDPRASMEREAKAQLLILEARLPLLGTLGNLSPYIGLFGTVVGIIRAFRDLALANAGGAAVVSQGIAEALTATATGLFVAVVASASYNHFQSRLDRMAREVELVIDEASEKLG
jgi:biopolymer transport protein ExbB/TolQ